MRVLVVGLGGAGTRIVDRMAQVHRPATLWGRVKAWFRSLFGTQQLDLAFLAADAPEATPDKWKGLRGSEFVPVGDGAGSGGDIGAADRIWRRDGGQVRDAAGEIQEWDLAVVVGAIGGGTAAGCMGPMAETLDALCRNAPVVAAPILPFEREADRAHRNAAPGLARLREADPLAALLLSNDRLGSTEGALSDVYEEANRIIRERLTSLLKGVSGSGVRAVDRADLETTMSPGNGFAVLGHARADPADEPEDVVAEALSPEAVSAVADPGEDASRVLLLVSGDPDDLEMGALLDQARADVPDREVLLGARAVEGEALEVLAVVGLSRARAAEAILDRFEELRAADARARQSEIDDRLDEVSEEPAGPDPEAADEEPEGDDEPQEEGDEADEGEAEPEAEEAEDGDEPDEEDDEEPPEWVEDYRAAQKKAMDLDIKANQKHEELIEAIREKQDDGG